MDMILYALLNKKVKGLASGVKSHQVNGLDLILTFNDGTSSTISFSQPKDGVSVDRLEFNETTNELLYYLTDGTSGSAGTIPVGKDGLSAYEIAKKNGFDGTEQEWLDSLAAQGGKIDIIRVNGEVVAINPDDKSVDITIPEAPVQSISVNNEEVEPDENGNINIAIPKAPVQSISQNGTALEIDENGNVDIPIADTNKIEVVKVNNTALEIDENKSVNIDLQEYAKTEDVEKFVDEQLYTTTIVEGHYELADAETIGALEVVADDVIAADGQINLSNVTPVLDGEVVAAGNYVIWVEAVETKDAKFLVEADLDPYVTEDEFKVMTEEELLEKLGLSEEELQGLAQLISDTEVRIDKTYSSSKIYNELNRILEEGKTYTLAEIAKSSGASYKIASSTTEMTSTKYIYLLANGDTYDMYICEEENSTPVKIGTTSVTLTDYYTKAECDERYVLATAFTLLNNSIGDVNNLQTTSKIIVDAINEVVISVDGMSTTVTETKDALGDITALETTAKDNVVNAVNEVKKSIDEFETYVELTQEEYDALADDETGKFNGTEYRTTDTGRIYKNGVQYGGQEPEVIESFAKYKEMKEAGLIDPDTEYIVISDENGILLNGNDVGYNNAESGIQATTVQGAVDKVAEKVDGLISDTSSATSTYSSAKIDTELAKKESVYTTNTPANLLYHAAQYLGEDPAQYKLYNVTIVDDKGNFGEFNFVYKQATLIYGYIISENGITLAGINNTGTLAVNSTSSYRNYRVKYLGIPTEDMTAMPNGGYTRANRNSLVTTRSLTLKTGYSGYITETYDATTKVVVYNINISGTFKGLLNSVADGFKIPKGSTSSSDVMHKAIGIYGSDSAMTGDAQFTRLLVRNYGNPHLEVDVNAEKTVISGTITYVTA